MRVFGVENTTLRLIRMPRANRHFLPGFVWHLTHRCHKREFLLKFKKDRRRWRHWLYQARKRYGLCVLNYVVTSNHIHLLVLDLGHGEIARSMQLVAGRTAQEFNRRKNRKGAFWEDRYFATAVQCDSHLARCLVYIDLNMVRAGVVQHPAEWKHGGFREIQAPPERYRLIDLDRLASLLGFPDVRHLQSAHRQWLEESLPTVGTKRDAKWTEAIAVGQEDFLEDVQSALARRCPGRRVLGKEGTYWLGEPATPYGPIIGAEKTPVSEKIA